MPGRRTFTRAELADAATALREQLDAWHAATAHGATGLGGPALEHAYAQAALLALDRRFVHRVRAVTGTRTTPLNELEVLAQALLHHGGRLQPHPVIRYRADQAVLGRTPGEVVELGVTDVERLGAAVLAEVAERFVHPHEEHQEAP